jgi:hypothetical protein
MVELFSRRAAGRASVPTLPVTEIGGGAESGLVVSASALLRGGVWPWLCHSRNAGAGEACRFGRSEPSVGRVGGAVGAQTYWPAARSWARTTNATWGYCMSLGILHVAVVAG